VVLLDHRVINQISTRRLRVIKYRGSVHGTNEYPFLIDSEGLTVLPITSLKLERKASQQRISSGIPSMDRLLGGKGFYRESSIMVSGTAGTGKTSIAAFFAAENCKRREKCMFFAFEESPSQIVRNMKSIGLNLEPYIKNGLLKFNSTRPATFGLEMHLANMYKLVRDFKPKAVVIDPITNLVAVGEASEVSSMLIRLIDFLQSEGITVLVTALLSGPYEDTQEGISSLVDTWIAVRDIETDGERNRTLYIMKSRGMKHSNQVREFIMTSKGVRLEEIYLGPEGVLIGSKRKEEQMKKLKGNELDASIKRQSLARLRQGNGKYRK
jgi:circadian clock protein KaiC